VGKVTQQSLSGAVISGVMLGTRKKFDLVHTFIHLFILPSPSETALYERVPPLTSPFNS